MALSGNDTGDRAAFQGFLSGLAAFTAWGLLPIYWKLLQDVEPMEVLCHRILWSVLFVGIVLAIGRRWDGLRGVLREPKKLGLLVLSGMVIGLNWLIYITAVISGKVLDVSLGYFINPLVCAFFGVVFFHDRLGRLKALALALAVGGVAYRLVLMGRLPLVALGLGLTFAVYGLLRKIVRVDVLTGLLVETLVIAAPALFYLLYRGHLGVGAFGNGSLGRDLLLAGTGIATSLPLLAFAYGAQRLSLVTVGFLQYLSPTMTFLLGVFLYREVLGRVELVTFALIWGAIALYSLDSVLRLKQSGGLPVRKGTGQ